MAELNITIEKMLPEDVEEVVALALITKELQIQLDKPQFYSVDQICNLIKSDDGVCITARVDGEFAGFGMATFHDYFKDGCFDDMAVKEEYRGMGIGKMLFEKRMEELKKKGITWAWALVLEDNTKMQKFIEKQGFKNGGKWIYYYKPNP